MLHFSISNKDVQSRFDHDSGPVEFGRAAGGAYPRCVIDDSYISANHLRVEELPGSRVRLTNLSQRHPVPLADGRAVEVGAICEVSLPVRATIGITVIEIRPASGPEDDPASLRSVAAPMSRS